MSRDNGGLSLLRRHGWLLAGAWTFPGGGQSAVLSSGAIAAMSIMAADEAASGAPVSTRQAGGRR